MDEDRVHVNYCTSIGEGGKTEWTKVMVTRLIDMYKERRCLYDSRIPSSREQRNACIQEIAVELGMSGLSYFYCLQCSKLVFFKSFSITLKLPHSKIFMSSPLIDSTGALCFQLSIFWVLPCVRNYILLARWLQNRLKDFDEILYIYSVPWSDELLTFWRLLQGHIFEWVIAVGGAIHIDTFLPFLSLSVFCDEVNSFSCVVSTARHKFVVTGCDFTGFSLRKKS